MSRLSRRLFLGRGAAAAAAAPILLGGAGPAIGGRVGQMPSWTVPMPYDAPPHIDPLEAAAQRLWMPEINRSQSAANKRGWYRTAPLDHSIAALRSVAPQHKAAMQRRADDRERSILTELRRKIWPNYEDNDF